LAAFMTLAEMLAQLLRTRAREGQTGTTIRMRMRAVGIPAPKAYLTVVATAQQWVFCFGDTQYRPVGQFWTYRPDDDGYLTMDLSAFDPDGQPSFFGHVPKTGALEPVQVEVCLPSEFHIVMPAGAAE